MIAYVDPASGVERVFEGRCRGRMAAEPRGEGGFGYDPVFLPDEGPPGEESPPALTMAELSDRAEGRDQPPRPGRAGAAGLARGQR